MQKFTINFFKGEYEKFSNFYPVVIYYEGRNYPSVEHAYVAAKTKDEFFRKTISELPAKSAGKAKKLGRNIKLRSNWDMVKYSIMKRFLMQKFSYHDFGDLLLTTGNSYIEEGNYWHDNYWGNCYCKKCRNIEGQNKLGKLLMEVRIIIAPSPTIITT
ncbi:MAG: NADAR family protein [Candidatus Thorarchaeota archaeon]